jgi:hypothetical protein
MPSPDTTLANEGEFSPTATVIAPGAIVNSDINAAAAIAFSKLAALPSGDILVGSAGTVPTAVAMSGEATIIASGAVTLANSVKVYTDKISLTSAEIKTLNSVGKLLVAAPTAGHIIQVLGVTGRINFSAAAYAANTALEIVDHTTGNVLFSDASALLASASTVIASIPPVVASATAPVGVIQTTAGAIWAKVLTGDPTTGSGTLDLYVTYKVVTL